MSDLDNDFSRNRYEYRFEGDVPAAAPKRGKKRNTAARVIALALSCMVLGAASGAGAAVAILRTQVKNTETAAPMVTESVWHTAEHGSTEGVPPTVQRSGMLTKAEVYARNVNSTVGIRTSVTTNYWGYQTQSAASGSGFILSEDGYILTNYHVVEDSNSITVSLYSGESYDAALLGFDEANDVAVLKIVAEGLAPVTVGDSDELAVGDDVIAIGNPLGELTFSLTAGAVSALNRDITMSNGVMALIQTDCAINSGNSGGALFNMYGEVVGITNAKYSGSSNGSASIESIGFAIPINHVREIVDGIIAGGYKTKAYIGVTVSDVSDELLRYGLPKGAVVREVTPGAPAAAAGLRVDDIITQLNGTAVTGSEDLVSRVGAMNPNDMLHLTVYRQGEYLGIDVTVGERIVSVSSASSQKEEQQSGSSYGQGGLPDLFGGFGSWFW